MRRFLSQDIIKTLSGRQPILIIALMLTTLTGFRAMSQTDPLFSQFYHTPGLYNPSWIGLDDWLRIRGGGRLQWVGVDRAPKAFAGAADMPFKFLEKKWATGLNIYNLSEGLYSTLSLNAQLGYKFRKFNGEFTVGLQLGLYDQSFKGSEVYIPDGDDYHDPSDDGIPTQDLHGTAIDFGVGLTYKHKYFTAGVSCTHLGSPSIRLKTDSESGGESSSTGGDITDRYFEFQAKRTLYLMGEGNIPIKNTLYEILPAIMVYSDFTFTGFEAMARLKYRKFITGGIGYRWKEAVTATIGVELKNFTVGYSYGYPLSEIRKVSSGNHEIFIGYKMKLDLGDKNRHKHKSIRIM